MYFILCISEPCVLLRDDCNTMYLSPINYHGVYLLCWHD